MKFKKLDEIGIDWRVSMKRHALYYAGNYGWRILPLHNPIINDGEKTAICSCGKSDCESVGKHPRIKEWSVNATSDKKQIIEWFNSWPDMNIGIATGPESGVVVLDVDGAKGKRSLLSCPPIPYTAIVKSGVGLHYYFEPPEGAYIKTLAGVLPGLDSRGSGGYVCAPPSLHSRGYRYEWLQATDIASVPQWWLDLVIKPKQIEKHEIKFDVKLTDHQIDAYGRVALENELAILYSTPIGQGLRNTNLNRASFSLYQLVAGGILKEELVENCLMDAAINGMQMDPAEALKTINSGKKGGMQKPRVLAQNNNNV